MELSIDVPEPADADEEASLTRDERTELLSKVDAAIKLGDVFHLARFRDFTIYSPERSALLRRREDSSTPLGMLGDGTLELVRFLAKSKTELFDKLARHLKPIDWFESIEFENLGGASDADVATFVRDRYVSTRFPGRSANEGFLLLLFYFALILSTDTPPVFAIENVDQTLNPRLCRKLAEEMSQALRDADKQAFVTIHNPMFLDGLDFRQKDIRLFIVKRNFDGHTVVRPVSRPERFSKGTTRLSQAFIDGQIGGLPENF